MNTPAAELTRKGPSLWQVILLSALAGGMGWGIRGQYGHQTGAMMAGLLVFLVVGMLFGAGRSSLCVARAAALGAVGIAFGGSMTYGQTVGLTHDKDLIGNWNALYWGLTGLFVKGALWIGFGGAFLGMGLSTRRYRPLELVLLFVALLALMFLGILLLNSPFDPETRRLPPIYFSMTWDWVPLRPDPKPRFENWGGLLLALIGLVAYVSAVRKDVLARNLALCGVLAGGLGFAGGQCIQAYHAWNQPLFNQGWFASVEPYMNWWNTMEITFGVIMGGGLGLGVGLNRGLVGPKEGEETFELSPAAEWLLLLIHPLALVGWEFLEIEPLEGLADLAFTMGMVPALGIVGGRFFVYGMVLPIIALPIAGKTLRQLAYKSDLMPVFGGWLLLVAVPLLFMSAVAWRSYRRGLEGEDGRTFAARALLAAVWVFFWLNFGFFEFPWPWNPPTSRWPAAVYYTLALVVLTFAALRYRRGTGPESSDRAARDQPPAVHLSATLEDAHA